MDKVTLLELINTDEEVKAAIVGAVASSRRTERGGKGANNLTCVITGATRASNAGYLRDKADKASEVLGRAFTVEEFKEHYIASDVRKELTAGTNYKDVVGYNGVELSDEDLETVIKVNGRPPKNGFNVIDGALVYNTPTPTKAVEPTGETGDLKVEEESDTLFDPNMGLAAAREVVAEDPAAVADEVEAAEEELA